MSTHETEWQIWKQRKYGNRLSYCLEGDVVLGSYKFSEYTDFWGFMELETGGWLGPTYS